MADSDRRSPSRVDQGAQHRVTHHGKSSAASIGEIIGISPGNVATKIHRIKGILVRRFHEGGHHGK